MPQKILILDPLPKGHQNFYLSLILKSLSHCDLEVITASKNRELGDHLSRRNVSESDFRVIEPDRTDALSALKQAAELVKKGNHDFVFVPYLDSFLEPLLRQFPSFPCPISGIWFHPYALDKKYGWLPPLDKRAKHRCLIHRTIKSQNTGIVFSNIFFLDPDSPKLLHRLNPSISSTVLVDPWERLPLLTQAEARERFGLPTSRTIFLHIGSTERRKGLAETVQAFHALSQEPSIRERVFLLRVGATDNLPEEEKRMMDELVASGMAQVIPNRVPESAFIEYFSASDCVLIPYRKFRYSSGILSNAIAAGKPVIATNAGLIGETVRSEGLGLTVASPTSGKLARAIHKFLDTELSFDVHSDIIANRDPNHFTISLCWPREQRHLAQAF